MRATPRFDRRPTRWGGNCEVCRPHCIRRERSQTEMPKSTPKSTTKPQDDKPRRPDGFSLFTIPLDGGTTRPTASCVTLARGVPPGCSLQAYLDQKDHCSLAGYRGRSATACG